MVALDPQQVSDSIKALAARQVRILTGVVQGYSENPQTTSVLLDNDSGGSAEGQPVVIPSVCGTLPSGARVSILTVPPAGMLVIGMIGIPYDLTSRSLNPTWVLPRSYENSGTWTVPDDPLFLGAEVDLQAGGGGSGGTAAGNTQSSSSGGGQGGGFLSFAVLALSLPAGGETVDITVGAGGAGAVAGNNPGGDGTESVFRTNAALSVAASAGADAIYTDTKFVRGGVLTLSPGLPAQESVTVISSLGSAAPYTTRILAPLTNSHLIAAAIWGAYGLVPGGEGGAGGGVAVAANNTTQNGGDADQLAGIIATNGAVFLDFQPGDNGGTGSRSGGGGNGVILPGIGGGSRMAATRRFQQRSNAPAIIDPAVGYPFGGGASGRGVDISGAFGAGTGADGADGIVLIREIYRT